MLHEHVSFLQGVRWNSGCQEEILVIKEMLLKTRFSRLCAWGSVFTEAWWPHLKLPTSRTHSREGWMEGCESWTYSLCGCRTHPSHIGSGSEDRNQPKKDTPTTPTSFASPRVILFPILSDEQSKNGKFSTHSILHALQSGPVAFRICHIPSEVPRLKHARTKSDALRKPRTQRDRSPSDSWLLLSC